MSKVKTMDVLKLLYLTQDEEEMLEKELGWVFRYQSPSGDNVFYKKQEPAITIRIGVDRSYIEEHGISSSFSNKEIVVLGKLLSTLEWEL